MTMDRVKVGVAGAGVFGGYHAGKMAGSAHADFIGVFDMRRDAADAQCAKLGKGEGFDSFPALLERCDAVVIATPATTHAGYVRQALQAGRHVLVEKPLALTGAEAFELADLAEAAGRVLQVGHQERLVFRAMGLLETNERPLRLSAVRAGPRPPNGRTEDVSVIHDLMIHDLDLAAVLLGGTGEILAARGRCVNTALVDEAVVELAFGEARVMCEASRCAPERRRTMRLDYPSGVVEIDLIARTVTNTTPHQLRIDVSDVLPDPLGAADEAFLAAVLGLGVSPAPGRSGAIAADLAARADAAARASA